MSNTTVIVVVVVVLVLLGVGLALVARQRGARREHLQERFGGEYDRTVEDAGSRRRAESELAAREQRRASLQIVALAPGRAEHFRAAWTSTQAQFVEQPKEAVRDADRLVGRLMAERGYPTGDFDQQAADLSVDHADVLDHYREAHRIGSDADEATTEELRQAMVHYRYLVDRLLEESASVADDEAQAQQRSDSVERGAETVREGRAERMGQDRLDGPDGPAQEIRAIRPDGGATAVPVVDHRDERDAAHTRQDDVVDLRDPLEAQRDPER